MAKTRENPLTAKVLPLSDSEAKYNARLKYITDPQGREIVVQRLCCERATFTDGLERDPAKKRDQAKPVRADPEALRSMSAEDLRKLLQLEAILDGRPWESDAKRKPTVDDMARAARRARSAVADYVLAEYDFTHFVTLTLDPAKMDRFDAAAAIKRLTVWLNNRVQRNGLKYLVVPEHHKDGAIHFHGLFNDALQMVDSGTVIRPEGGKPVKRATALRSGADLTACKVVYNLPAWDYGYTTAIELTGDRAAVAGYVCKYIVKELDYADGDRDKIGGRYYYHSTNLRKPKTICYDDDFETFEGYAFDTPGGRWKVNREHTELCKGERLHLPAKGPFAAGVKKQ